MKTDIEYSIITGPDQAQIVKGRSAREALGIFLKRGRHGLGKDWSLTRQKNGWIIASPSANKSLERCFYKLRETNYNPKISQRHI